MRHYTDPIVYVSVFRAERKCVTATKEKEQTSFIWEGFVGGKRKGNDAIIFQFKNIIYMLINLSGFEIPQVAKWPIFGGILIKSLVNKMGSW